jgi:protein tyrosine phosphatase (PTP) superfamily phosphohydrolase (DUF442 family)
MPYLRFKNLRAACSLTLALLTLVTAPKLRAQQEAAVQSPALKEIKNFHHVSDSLGSAGQPTAEQFRAVKEAGYEVVINLAPSEAQNALKNEREVVEGLGLKYVHIPVVWTAPKAEDAERFFAAMDAAKGKKLFVHCIANYRASAFVYLYRVTRLGVSEEEAARDLHALWKPNETWQQLINEVKAKSR